MSFLAARGLPKWRLPYNCKLLDCFFAREKNCLWAEISPCQAFLLVVIWVVCRHKFYKWMQFSACNCFKWHTCINWLITFMLLLLPWFLPQPSHIGGSSCTLIFFLQLLILHRQASRKCLNLQTGFGARKGLRCQSRPMDPLHLDSGAPSGSTNRPEVHRWNLC